MGVWTLPPDLMQIVRKCLDNKADWDVYLPDVLDNKADWDVYLPDVLFACQEAPSSATIYFPFELLFGKHAHGPLDVLRQQWVPTSKTPRDATEWLYNLREMLDSMRTVAANRQRKIKEYS